MSFYDDIVTSKKNNKMEKAGSKMQGNFYLLKALKLRTMHTLYCRNCHQEIANDQPLLEKN